MKITKAADRKGFGTPSGPRYGPPQWLEEWLENQGKYVELACGHMVDLKDSRNQPLIHPSDKLVDCEIHRAWQRVKQKVTFHEFAGIRVNPIPDEPLF